MTDYDFKYILETFSYLQVVKLPQTWSLETRFIHTFIIPFVLVLDFLCLPGHKLLQKKTIKV